MQAIGAAYLLFISLNHLFRKFILHRNEDESAEDAAISKPKKVQVFG